MDEVSPTSLLGKNRNETDDRDLTLGELYQHVFDTCQSQGQTPLLLKAGEGLKNINDTDLDSVLIAKLPQLEKPPAEEAAEEAAQPASEDQGSAALAVGLCAWCDQAAWRSRKAAAPSSPPAEAPRRIVRRIPISLP